MKILIAGEGGQGVQVLSKIVAESANSLKYHVSYIPHYGVEMRMGISFAYITIEKKTIIYPKFFTADILIVMSKRQLDIPKQFIDKNTRVINATSLHSELENNKLSYKSLNMMVLGILIKELNTTDFRIDSKVIKSKINEILANKTEFIGDNIKSFDLGMLIENEKYSQNINKIKRDELIPVVDSDKEKTHIKFPKLCKGCGLCIEKCPVNALGWSETTLNYISRPIPKVDISKCIACLNCENICPDCAIKIIKKKK